MTDICCDMFQTFYNFMLMFSDILWSLASGDKCIVYRNRTGVACCQVSCSTHVEVMTRKCFPHYWPFVRGIHWWHQISALLALCEGNPPDTGGFPSQRASNTEHRCGFWPVKMNILCADTRLVYPTARCPPWHGNSFRITGPLWGESTSHWWIPPQRASNTVFWCFVCYHPNRQQAVIWHGSLTH